MPALLMADAEGRLMIEGNGGDNVSAAAQVDISSDTTLDDVFREYHKMVFRAAHRVTGNAADAEDVLQTVFLRLSRNRPEAVGSMASYLYRAAVNCAFDLMRSRQAGPMLSLEEARVEFSEDPGHSPEELRQGQELAEWLRSTVARLSPRTAEIFALRYFEGLDNAEIARLVGSSEGTIAVTLHRARTRLIQEFSRFTGGRS
ncbi:MAG: RNA polymerase sigma factor [Bryobacteraceae bacterium]